MKRRKGLASVLLGMCLAWPVSCLAQLPTSIPGAAQMKGLLSNMLAPAASASAPMVAAPQSPPGRGVEEQFLKASPRALNDLQVDRLCLKVEERFDVWEKAAEYGGVHAQRRLNALLASNFEHSDLTQTDKDMLRYLAYTTVWVPASVESGIGTAWATLSSAGSDGKAEPSGRSQRKALQRLNERLTAMRSGIDGFPGGAKLVLDNDLRDGAFARVGGIVVVSPRFLSLMDEKDAVRDVVLAHELSHLYKRHTIKELQYKLVSSSSGWNIAKKALARVSPSSAGGAAVLRDGLGYGILVADLVSFMRSTQLDYSREQELEADACAMQWLGRMDISPREAWQAFAGILSYSSASQGNESSYESLHPSPAERDANINAAMSLQPGRR
jgi:hypothetical protein